MIDRLKEFRKIFFKTQQQLAETLGVSRFMVSEYENGKTLLSMDKAKILVKDYNLNLNWLVCGIGNMTLNKEDIINIQELQKECERLKIENNLLKELINKK